MSFRRWVEREGKVYFLNSKTGQIKEMRDVDISLCPKDVIRDFLRLTDKDQKELRKDS